MTEKSVEVRCRRVGRVKSRVTGGHLAFRNEGTKPFVNKMTEAMTVKLRSSDTVVDIGAYIGEYSMFAARSGAGKVIAYEPTPASFDLLRQNTRQYPQVLARNLAVVGNDAATVELHMSPGIGVTNSIAKKGKRGGVITVHAIRYEDAVACATVVKIDVEGAEYSYDIVQPHIRAFIIEFHPLVGCDWKSNAVAIMDRLESSGYRPTISRPGFTNGWDLHGAWERT